MSCALCNYQCVVLKNDPTQSAGTRTVEPKTLRTKWQLDSEALARLLGSLASEGEDGGEAYLELRRNLVRFFEVRSVAFADDHADEVLNRLAHKLATGTAIENAKTYALGIARMVVLEVRKSPQSRTDYILPDIPATENAFDTAVDEARASCLDKCLDDLTVENRELIVGYYSGEKSEKIGNRVNIAKRLGIAQNALRNRAVRLRNTLEACITDCLGRS
ncbi:MAG TPA: hypothetical protein DDW24_15645 [Blastocatellia bacterium]|nr:hypothetical protein [Blastocatellia bacterium]